MKLVVEIPEEQYITLNAKTQEEVVAILDYTLLVNAIKNGILIPKGHGRIIDESNIKACEWDGFLKIMKTNAPTIVEADKEQKNEQCI